jgi:hypothetical protein
MSGTGTPRAGVPAAPLHWRRSVIHLTDGQLQLLRDGIEAIKDIGDEERRATSRGQEGGR